MNIPIKRIFHESSAYIAIELPQWWTKKAEIEPPANSKHPKYKKPEETADISRLVSREMTSGKRLQKFRTDDVSLNQISLTE